MAARPLVLLGAGRMGGALLRGWLAAGTSPDDVIVVDPAWQGDGSGVRAVPTVSALGTDRSAATLVIAVKPQILAEALEAARPLVADDTLVLSVAAGTPIATLGRLTGGTAPVVRAMPNLPAQIGRGVTAAVARGDVGGAARDAATALLGAVGSVVWLDDEAQMDAVTAVSGSGPAYVFHLCECLEAAGRDAGLPAPLAARLARETVAGAGALLGTSLTPAETLRRDVTSPGGTTAAALSVLMRPDGLAPLLSEAVAAATARSRELG